MHRPNKEYEYWGYYELTGSMSANSLRAGTKGPNNIRFADGHHIRFTMTDFRLGGTIAGERTIEPVGNIYVEDLTNNIKAVVKMNTYKKTGWIRV